MMTFPLWVLKAMKGVFQLQLSSKHQEAIENLRFGLMSKIFVEYDHKFGKGQIWIINKTNEKIV
jgi:hypothetical protein